MLAFILTLNFNIFNFSCCKNRYAALRIFKQKSFSVFRESFCLTLSQNNSLYALLTDQNSHFLFILD